MKYTNKFKLPQSLVDALTNDDYDLTNAPANIISVTTSIAPAKLKTLEWRHWDALEADVSELLWRMMGTACHYVVELAAKGERLSEERWYLDVIDWTIHTAPEGVKAQDCKWFKKDHIYLSGKMDVYDHATKKVEDYKFTSLWSWMFDRAAKPEHIAQLNMNSFAIRLLGFPVEKASIVMLFKDWSKSAMRKGEYNDKFSGECLLPVNVKEVAAPMWNDDFTKEYIMQRINQHIEAKTKYTNDDDIPECTPEERWSKPTKYAVMKKGKERALRLHDTLEQAEIHAKSDPALQIEERKGGDIRCTDYCSANFLCSYYKKVYGNSNK
jgi:hypothetical protein